MQTHRFAFTISGGLAMGAYEAGVLVQLYQDMHAINNPASGLNCRLVIDAVSGASAGSITGLILAQALATKLTPADFHDRMWQTWVVGPDADLLLQPADGPEQAVFTQNQLDAVAAGAVPAVDGSDPFDPKETVAIWMAITNPDGVPLRIVFKRENGEETTLYGFSYRDYVPYFICGTHVREVSIPTEELAATPGNPQSWWERCQRAEWQAAIDAALASSSFPVAFRTKALTRDLTRYGDYSQWKQPEWPDTLTCQVMDGGIFGNEPIGKAIDAVSYLERLDPERAGDQRTYLMIEPQPNTPETISAALDEIQSRQTPNGLNPISAVLKMIQAYFNDALYSDFANANKINQQLAAIDDLHLEQETKADVLKAVGLDHKKPVALERIPHTVPTRNRLAGDFFGDFGGFLQQNFREHDFCVGRQEGRAWIVQWLTQNADSLDTDAEQLVAALGDAPLPYMVNGAAVDLSDASWCVHMTEIRRNELVNRGLDRLEELLFRWLNMNGGEKFAVKTLRHVLGGEIHRSLVDCPPH